MQLPKVEYVQYLNGQSKVQSESNEEKKCEFSSKEQSLKDSSTSNSSFPKPEFVFKIKSLIPFMLSRTFGLKSLLGSAL